LPIYPELTPDMQEYVVDRMISFFRKNWRGGRGVGWILFESPQKLRPVRGNGSFWGSFQWDLRFEALSGLTFAACLASALARWVAMLHLPNLHFAWGSGKFEQNRPSLTTNMRAQFSHASTTVWHEPPLKEHPFLVINEQLVPGFTVWQSIGITPNFFLRKYFLSRYLNSWEFSHDIFLCQAKTHRIHSPNRAGRGRPSGMPSSLRTAPLGRRFFAEPRIECHIGGIMRVLPWHDKTEIFRMHMFVIQSNVMFCAAPTDRPGHLEDAFRAVSRFFLRAL